jgi:hypothetical protein
MPLIKARTNRVKTVRHICRLQEPNRDTLVRYAQFIGDTPDYVVNQLIATTLAKDRDFLAWQPADRHEGTAAVTTSGQPAPARRRTPDTTPLKP